MPSEESLFINGEQSLIIEGRITNTTGAVNRVLVSKSVSGDSEYNFEPINNAIVRLRHEETGDRETLELSGDGEYVLNSLFGIPENNYKLEVFYDDAMYESFEQMPSSPDISLVTIKYQNSKPFEPGFYVSFTLKKRIDAIGYYKIEITLNDSILSGYGDLIIFEDRLFNDIQFYKLPMAFNKSDTISVYIYAISENVYEYYMGLSKQTTNLFSNIQPPSTNPDNNILPDVLGYFQASSVFSIDTVMPDSLE